MQASSATNKYAVIEVDISGSQPNFKVGTGILSEVIACNNCGLLRMFATAIAGKK